MKWNSRGPHGQLLRGKMAAGEVPWEGEGGNAISDTDIKPVYDGYTEFNKNYTKSSFILRIVDVLKCTKTMWKKKVGVVG